MTVQISESKSEYCLNKIDIMRNDETVFRFFRRKFDFVLFKRDLSTVLFKPVVFTLGK